MGTNTVTTKDLKRLNMEEDMTRNRTEDCVLRHYHKMTRPQALHKGGKGIKYEDDDDYKFR